MHGRKLVATLLCTGMVAGVGASGAAAFARDDRGNSNEAPGYARAEEQCDRVVFGIQADLRAGGGPKSQSPSPQYPDGTGPAECDHLWKRTGTIGSKK